MTAFLELNMATMATTSHGLSVYMNSCVKNTVNSRNRTGVSFAERESMHPKFAATDPGPILNSSNEFAPEEEYGGESKSLPVRASFEDFESQLRSLTDDQFYFKLQQLKEANQKTLEECEELFREKYGAEDSVGKVAAKEMVENMFAARLAARSGHVAGHTMAVQNGDMTNGYASDRIRDNSAKPPPVPGSKRESSLLKTAPARSALPTYSAVSRQRPSSAPSRNYQPRRSYSLDDEDWNRAMRDSPDISDDEVQSEGPLDPELLAAVSKIRHMWRGFKIDDYAPGERRHSSASATNRKKKEDHDLAENWRHRITIPKPFQMSQREATKTKKKTKAQEDLEEQRLAKQREEEEECQKKFKAQPAPAHIYLPLFDEIQEKNETRRRYAKQCSEEMLRSQEKPFKFLRREEEKKQQRVRSATVAEQIARSAQKVKRREEKFVARPVPDSVYSSAPRDRLLEEEEYRKIRIKMRAKELLRESSLPPNMEARQKLKEQKEKEKLMKAKQKIHSHSKRHQRSSHKVPDYDFLYREFQKELARRKHTKEATVVEPFSLDTNGLRSSRERVLRDMERDEKLMRESARGTPRLNLGRLSSSLDSIPCKSTNSADLRTGHFRTLKERDTRKEEQKVEEERRRQMREAKLRRYIMERSDETPRRTGGMKERLRRHKDADIARLEQYEKDLEEMKERVEKRPLLFERETQINAGKAAEKKFKTTLKSAGIDEDFVRTRSSAAPSTSYYDEEDEDDNATFTKSRYREEEEALS